MKPSTGTAKQSRKDVATTFLHQVATGQVAEAYDRYAAPSFRHHNAYFRGDARSLATAMAENAAQFPHKELESKLAIEDQDLVAVYSRVRHTPEGPDYAVAHFFRFEGDRIAELWDVGQEVPKDSPNENGMF